MWEQVAANNAGIPRRPRRPAFSLASNAPPRYNPGGSSMSLVIDSNELDHLPISVDRDVMSGAPVFRGTRVPLAALLDNLEAGVTLDEFLDNFPTVMREQAVRV